MTEPQKNQGLMEWIKDRPWILVILLLALMMGIAITTLMIAQAHKPILLPRSAG